ncbi:Xaa-Pro dipeptidase [Hahella sp. CCB-MM4]|uniref:Xaa-Pro dipeptidase n=1 Tax=Hahella sp. (strain CCB-MM4) TaxID=1926491 RepID=UPI000B9BD235|nr:Xaa-Pro dipeptidase [Hahella sp. CCB-MM4]OZG75405.1 Xaa-Pro dipeptidase [Hahella sp. CCB-MM4]
MPHSYYAAHLTTLRARYEEALEATGFDAVIIPSGGQTYYYADDHAHPYHAAAMAQQWVPFKLIPHLHILVRPQQKPVLLWPGQRDFWHVVHSVPEGEWQNGWDVETVTDAGKHLSALLNGGRTAWIGPESQVSSQIDKLDINPTSLVHHLNFQRACKTHYEIDCLSEANKAGMQGHLAAKEAFMAGASEYEIYHAFLQGSRQLSIEEPYPGIVALNENAAVLHYENKGRENLADSRTLLIDAGADYLGYASDITRTYTRHNGLFGSLITAMNQLQKTLVEGASAGVHFSELHHQALTGIAIILQETGICSHAVEIQLEKRIPQVFFPHGLGHFLGLQVHDVGGHQQDSQGTLRKPGTDAPFLRLTRKLEENMVVTIEPGLYFIPMLLENMVQDTPQHGCDLELIETLRPYGGIRIEDNVVVQQGSSRNLTREFSFD